MSRGLLLVGHGSHLSGNSSAPVFAHADAVRAMGLFDQVRASFWKEEPSLSRALDGFDCDDVTIVPVMISSGYFTSDVIPREMGLNGRMTSIAGKRIRYTGPIGGHPALASVIVQRAREAGADGSEALAVLGHGTPRHPESAANVFRQAAFVREMRAFAEVGTIFLDQDPNMRSVFEIVSAEAIVVVPLFVADGWHVGETIPEDLALDGAETRRGGRRLRYAAAVGTHPSVATVICELADEAAAW